MTAASAAPVSDTSGDTRLPRSAIARALRRSPRLWLERWPGVGWQQCQRLQLADDGGGRDRSWPGEHGEQLVDGLPHGEPGGSEASIAPRHRPECDRGTDALRERLGVVGDDERDRAAVGLREAAVVRRDHPASCVLGLDGDDAEGLVPVLAVRGHHDDVVVDHERGHVRWCVPGRDELDAGVSVEDLADDLALRLVGSRGGRREGELDVLGDEVVVQHRQKGVDALLGAQPPGIEDPRDTEGAGLPGLDAEAGLGERVDHLDGGDVDVHERRPQARRELAGGDETPVTGLREDPAAVVVAPRGWDVQDLVRRALGRDDGELGDEHHRAVELADVGSGCQRQERDVHELITAVGGAEPDGDHLGSHAAPVQLPDVSDRVVLRATRAGRQPFSGGPDEGDHPWSR